jgi:hypothetical protein
MMSSLASGALARTASLTAWAAGRLLTAMTTWAPRSASVRAVLEPMPLDAPAWDWVGLLVRFWCGVCVCLGRGGFVVGEGRKRVG